VGNALPDPGTPLADAWRRVVGYAKAAGAGGTAGQIGADAARGRGNESAIGVAQAYGVDPDDIVALLDHALRALREALMFGAYAEDAFGSVGATLLLTGVELHRDPRDGAPVPAEPEADKRDVLLDYCSNPDAALNALHQAGWKIVPR
jgi:hypothetical protein